MIFIARKYVCPICKDKDYEANMTIDYIGKQKKRFHPDCHEQHLEDQEFKKKEKEEMDDLVETIKEIHGIEIIPSQFYSFLQDIRNGNELFGNIGQKKSKQGYEYRVIEETYRQCIDSINWAMNNRNFKNTLAMLKYTRAIVMSNIAEVNEMVKRKEQQEKEMEYVDQDIDFEVDDEVAYKKQDDGMDISQFL